MKSNAYTPVNEATSDVIKRWYQKLPFPEKYKDEFEQALLEIPISHEISIDTYDIQESDGKRNLLSYLYLCEELKESYEKKGISEKVILDTLEDIVLWTDTWSGVKNELYLGELGWLKRHMTMQLFRLGRLQFCMGVSEHDIPSLHVAAGDKVLEIHIPSSGDFSEKACQESIERAKEFFAAYYPGFEYKCFTCHSWLLDPTLQDLLKPESNILKFQNRFELIEKEKSDAVLRYVFQWDTTRENLQQFVCTSGLAKKVKDHVLAGNDFYEVFGAIEK